MIAGVPTAGRRAPFAALALAIAACSSPTLQERTVAGELAAVAPLKTRYAGVVMGFDIRPSSTLIVSVDLQSYIEMDDDSINAMQHAVLARWAAAWHAAHPHERGVVRVRFIDFIGRKVATLTAR